MQFIKNNKKLIIISAIIGLVLAIYLNNADPVIFRHITRWPFLVYQEPSTFKLCSFNASVSTKSEGFPFAINDVKDCEVTPNIIGLLFNYLIIVSLTIALAVLAKTIFNKLKGNNNSY